MPFKKHVQIERYIVRKDIQIKLYIERNIYRKKYLLKEISVERGKYKKDKHTGRKRTQREYVKEDTLKRKT